MAAALQRRWVARLHQIDSGAELRFNYEVGRWEFRLTSGDGVLRSQFWGWYRNPLTGQPIKPDEVTGLFPFRDLDDLAIEEACANLERTFVGNAHDGAGSTQNEVLRRHRFNEAHRKRFYKDAGELWADMYLDRLGRIRGDATVPVEIELNPHRPRNGPPVQLFDARGKLIAQAAA